MIDILLNALIAGLLLAAVAGPLGSLVVWQRMAYYGDTLAHSALLGIALGFMLNLNLQVAVLGASLAIACLLFALQQWRDIAFDSLLGILSHTSLALGLVFISRLDNQRIDFNALLFGDLLAVVSNDLVSMLAISAIILGLLGYFWRALVSITAHADLAAVEGAPVKVLRLLMMLMIAATVAVAMKIVGVLLVSAMLIIPASTAGRLAHSPEQTAGLAVLFGASAVIAGLAAAWYGDTAAGPSIVLVAGLQFLLVQFWPAYRRQN